MLTKNILTNFTWILQISLYPTRHINKTWNCSEINLKSQKVKYIVSFEILLFTELVQKAQIFEEKNVLKTKKIM